jgi:hypothetical protein
MLLLSFLEGLGFDPFFRGFLSVMVGVVVMIGGTYMIVASNSGARTGGLISASALFGWMFLMGIIWTVYGIGWRGQAPTWELVEVNRDLPASDNDGLDFAENQRAVGLGRVLEGFDVTAGVTSDDPDIAQTEAVEYAKANADDLDGWRYLATSNPVRGEAQSAADEHLIEEHVFDSTAEYVPLQFGAYSTGGKPLLKDNPNVLDRVWHKIDSMTLHAIHTQELMVIQVQGVVEQPTLPGQPPPVARADAEKSVVSVIMERDRGGPLPALFGGLRFTPAMFTIFNGILFALVTWMLHVREKREFEIRARA